MLNLFMVQDLNCIDTALQNKNSNRFGFIQRWIFQLWTHIHFFYHVNVIDLSTLVYYYENFYSIGLILYPCSGLVFYPCSLPSFNEKAVIVLDANRALTLLFPLPIREFPENFATPGRKNRASTKRLLKDEMVFCLHSYSGMPYPLPINCHHLESIEKESPWKALSTWATTLDYEPMAAAYNQLMHWDRCSEVLRSQHG